MERLTTDYEWSVLVESDTTPRCSVWWRINGTSRGRKRKTGEHGRNEKETAQRRAFSRISYGCCVLELNRSMRAGFQNFGGLVLGFIMFYGNCEAEFPKKRCRSLGAPSGMVSKLFFWGNGKIIEPRGIALIFADTAESLTQVPQTPSTFHLRTRQNAFRRRNVRLQSSWFAPWNQSLRRSPTPTGFAEIAADDFPLLTASDI